jgi:hypothetical protein
VRLLLNIILAFQRKMLFPFAPTSVPFNPIFFLFFTFLLLLILLNNYRKIVRKKIKKIPNINLRQGINPILLFFLNWSLNKNFSEKTKSVPHSPGLPYWIVLSNRESNMQFVIEVKRMMEEWRGDRGQRRNLRQKNKSAGSNERKKYEEKNTADKITYDRSPFPIHHVNRNMSHWSTLSVCSRSLL